MRNSLPESLPSLYYNSSVFFLGKLIYMLITQIFKASSIHSGSWNNSVHFEVSNTVLKFKEENLMPFDEFFLAESSACSMDVKFRGKRMMVRSTKLWSTLWTLTTYTYYKFVVIPFTSQCRRNGWVRGQGWRFGKIEVKPIPLKYLEKFRYSEKNAKICTIL